MSHSQHTYCCLECQGKPLARSAVFNSMACVELSPFTYPPTIAHTYFQSSSQPPLPPVRCIACCRKSSHRSRPRLKHRNVLNDSHHHSSVIDIIGTTNQWECQLLQIALVANMYSQGEKQLDQLLHVPAIICILLKAGSAN
jgi:hypothetical protein